MKNLFYLFVIISLTSCGNYSLVRNGNLRKVKVEKTIEEEVYFSSSESLSTEEESSSPVELKKDSAILELDLDDEEDLADQFTEDENQEILRKSNTPTISFAENEKSKLVKKISTNSRVQTITSDNKHAVSKKKARRGLSQKAKNVLLIVGLSILVIGFLVWYIISPITAGPVISILIAIIGIALIIAAVVWLFKGLIFIMDGIFG